MRDRLVHRGPDGGRSWRTTVGSTTVAFGHRRLSIIDLSHDADQPMFDPSGRLALIYNGEIYNYVELRRELTAAGRRFRTSSDTEVLLAAYERWGTDCLSRLNGMFAFAIWDEQRRELFVARDRFGEKPLFFTQLRTGGIAFASEMKALFAHDAVDARVHWPSVEAYIAGDFYEDRGQTMFEGVERLMQAEAMIVGAHGEVRRRWRYWTPDYDAIRDDYTEPAAFDEFLELLDRSIRMRLRSDVPIGTSLSGGLDSSFIVCLLAGLRGENPMLTQNTFSGRFDNADPTMSEGRQIDLVVERSGVQAHAVTPTAEGLVAESERLHWHQEEPFLSASIYMQWCVMRIAKDQHTTVLLDGQGADELLAGYQYYFPTYQLDLVDRFQLMRLVRETVAFRRRLRRASDEFANSDRRFNKDVALSFAALIRALARKPSVWRGPYEEGVPAAIPGSRLRRVIAEALQYNSLPQLLRYADRNAMAFSRETRFPFLDHDLVDWCTQLPDRAFVAEGWQKWVLRRAAQNVLPPEIQWRADKVGYAAPLDLWLRGSLQDWAESRVFASVLQDLRGYDATALRQLWSEHQAGTANHSWGLWRWISLTEWLALVDAGAWRAGIEHAPERIVLPSGGRA